jgi:hypothetical protein
LSETDDQYLPGLTEALIGLKRGDRVLLGIPPSTLATKTVSKPLLESSNKKHPLGYLVVMLEINKIRSSEKKSKDSSAAAPATVVPFATAASTVPQSDDHLLQSNTLANTAGVTPDLSSRMAKLSGASSSNAAQLANIMNPKAKSVSFTEQNQIHHIEPIGGSTAPDNSASSSAPVNVTPVKLPQVQPQQQQSPPVQVQQQQSQPQQAPIQQVQQQPLVVQSTIQQQPQQYQQHQQQQQQQPQSMISTNTNQNQNQSFNNNLNSNSNSSSSGDYGGNVSSNQLASSMMIIQQSLMSLHTKLDQVNMTVNNCSSLTQQSSQSLSLLPSLSQQLSMAVQSLSSSVSSSSPGGAAASPNQQQALMMGGGSMGMGHPMNMNPMMGYPPNPMMMMNPYQMYGMMGSPVQMSSSPLPVPSSSTVCSNPQIKLKNDEIHQNLSFILSQYEMLKNENNELKNKVTSLTATNDNTEKIKQFELKVLSLEEKAKTLEVSGVAFDCSFVNCFSCCFCCSCFFVI